MLPVVTGAFRPELFELRDRARIVMNMIDYHVYTLGKNGHLTGRVDLKCPNDEAAEKRVRLLMDRDDVELWRLDGRVVVFCTKPDSRTDGPAAVAR